MATLYNFFRAVRMIHEYSDGQSKEDKIFVVCAKGDVREVNGVRYDKEMGCYVLETD